MKKKWIKIELMNRLLSFVTVNLLILSTLSFGQEGSLITSFANAGKFTGFFTAGGGITFGTKTSVAVQSDGKILLASGANLALTQFGILRLNTNGTVDSAFGVKGFKAFTVPNASSNYPFSVVLQQDGKIILAGYSIFSGNIHKFTLTRITTTGRIDSTFGTNQTGYDTLSLGPTQDDAYSAVVQSDGKIILGGVSRQGTSADFALARFLPNGGIDPQFGTNGKVLIDIAGKWDRIQTIKLQSDGNIVACGRANEDVNADFALVRITTTGKLDSTFGSSGKVVVNVTSSDLLYGLSILKNGSIVAAGRVQDSLSKVAMIKVLSTGKQDTTFGIKGLSIQVPAAQTSYYTYDLLEQDDGKLVTIGYAAPTGQSDDFIISRFNANGFKDNTFGTNGSVVIDMTGSGGLDDGYSLARSSDGNVLAVGMVTLSVGNAFGVVKIKSTGLTSETTQHSATLNYSLEQNYPNPFNPTTTIRYALPTAANVKLSVFDLLGREVATLVNEDQQAGWKEVQWNAKNVSSGIYFYRMESGSLVNPRNNFAEVRKLVLIK